MTAKANKMMEYDPGGQPAVEKHAPEIGHQHAPAAKGGHVDPPVRRKGGAAVHLSDVVSGLSLQNTVPGQTPGQDWGQQVHGCFLRWTGAASMKFSPISSGSKSATFRSTFTPPATLLRPSKSTRACPGASSSTTGARLWTYLKNAYDWESDEGLAFIRYYTRRILR